MNDELIEKMARAAWACMHKALRPNEPLGLWGEEAEEVREVFRAVQRAALSAIHGEHVMLPREPTKVMKDNAALQVMMTDWEDLNEDDRVAIIWIYRAMIEEGEIK